MGDKVMDTLADRGDVYGSFHGNSFMSQELKSTLHSSTGWPRLSDVQKEALELMCTKIGRIMTGDPSFVDNWHDIAGYAQLVEESLTPVEIPPISDIPSRKPQTSLRKTEKPQWDGLNQKWVYSQDKTTAEGQKK